jgi:hypothetical protein
MLLCKLLRDKLLIESILIRFIILVIVLEMEIEWWVNGMLYGLLKFVDLRVSWLLLKTLMVFNWGLFIGFGYKVGCFLGFIVLGILIFDWHAY